MDSQLTVPAKLANITPALILTRLQQRVSKTNARILLDAAKIQTGVRVEDAVELDKEQAVALCKRLIAQGGPAFQVGQSLYKEYLL